jgi:hypothetical protein
VFGEANAGRGAECPVVIAQAEQLRHELADIRAMGAEEPTMDEILDLTASWNAGQQKGQGVLLRIQTEMEWEQGAPLVAVHQ